jgi:hypothetical protein
VRRSFNTTAMVATVIILSLLSLVIATDHEGAS